VLHVIPVDVVEVVLAETLAPAGAPPPLRVGQGGPPPGAA
jgi:hypothetical protein